MRNILLTGWTGNIGREAARQLRGCHTRALVRNQVVAEDGVEIVVGALNAIPEPLAADTEVIIHSAADTSFRASLEHLRAINVEGTRAMLEFAARCPRLNKFIHVSTACISGDTTGLIPEDRAPRPAAFLNPYEQSKWEAEELVLQSDLPVQVIRLSIVAGSERDGSVRRPGALHHALFWLWRGLIPMMPGTVDTPVDMISTEYAASFITAAVHTASVPRVIHACAGADAPRLGDLLGHLSAEFRTHSAAWRSGAILPPTIVDAQTFALFEDSVRQSGDSLFLRVSEDAKSFLPSLLHPRVYATEQARALNPKPIGDWRNLAGLVTRHAILQHTRSLQLPIRAAASGQ